MSGIGAPKIRRRLDGLTSLRFFAALHVVLFHYGGTLLGPVPVLGNVAALGYYAVSFFYVLSGFVLIYSYTDDNGRARTTQRSFWRSRLIRLYPAYVLGFVLCVPKVVDLIQQRHTGAGKALLAACSYLLMIQAWHPRLVAWWNYPGWSLSVEAFFYLCFPFLLKRIRGIGVQRCYLLIGASWLISASIYCASHMIENLDANELWSHGLGYDPLLRMPAFLTGMATGKLYLLRREVAAGSAVPALCALALCCLAIAASTIFKQLTLRDTIVVPAYAYSIFRIAADESVVTTLLAWRPLVLLGNASYAIYILQWPVFSLAGEFGRLSDMSNFPVYLLLLAAVSVCFFMLVEEPLRRASRVWVVQ